MEKHKHNLKEILSCEECMLSVAKRATEDQRKAIGLTKQSKENSMEEKIIKQPSKETIEAIEEAKEIVEERKQELRKDEAYRLAVIETKKAIREAIKSKKVDHHDSLWNDLVDDILSDPLLKEEND